MTSSLPTFTPISASHPSFGAIASNINLEELTDEAFACLRDVLFKYNVVCVKGQQDLSPKAQAELTRRFDPQAKLYGHDNTFSDKRSILHPDLKTCPYQPEVQVIGNGHIDDFLGLKDIQLKHPHHRTFHKSVIPDDKDLDYTHYYRWHIDAALYGSLNPSVVTTLMAVKVPKSRKQTVLYDDGSNDTLQVPLGTTAFVSGYDMLNNLSLEDQDFVLTSKVEYAPHPYVWMSGAKSNSVGLGMETEGKELPLDQLPPYTEDAIMILPMAWQNPVTKAYALEVHPSAIRKIHKKDGTVIDDLKTVRDIVYRLQRPAIAPEHVYAHDWDEGDMVIFHNRGVLHTVVGAFTPDEVRLFRQCNLAATYRPIGPEDAAKGAVAPL